MQAQVAATGAIAQAGDALCASRSLTSGRWPQDAAQILASAPHWARHFRSDDVQEVRALIGLHDGPNTRVVRREGPLGYAMFQVRAQCTNLGASQSGLAQVVRGHVHGWVLYLSLPEGTALRLGSKTSAPSVPASVALVPPGWAVTRISPPGTLLAVEADCQAVLDEVSARRPDEKVRNMQRLCMPVLSDVERAALLTAFSELVAATEPGVDTQLRALWEGHLIERIAKLLLPHEGFRRPGELALRTARSLEDWIDAHLGEPITMGVLCRVAGVGERCLQKSFIYRRGVSPMRFVTERRLLAAHHWLGDPANTGGVTEAGLRFGFSHLGRFAGLYRKSLGELPQETRWAALGRQAPTVRCREPWVRTRT
jgi:AraC-like DNA-binding protein